MAKTHAADYRIELDTLLDLAAGMDNGPAKIAVLERAVQIADANGDLDAGYSTRMDLIQVATFSGIPEVSLAAYPWCLAQADAHPGRFNEHDLLWRYKWVAHEAISYPQITLAQIHGMVDDLAARYEQFGSSAHPVHILRLRIALATHDPETAKRSYSASLKTPRSSLSDCIACEVNLRVDYYVAFHRYKEALFAARPILNGMMRCGVVPHCTYGELLYPLVKLRDRPRADEYCAKCIKLIGRNLDFANVAAQCLVYSVLNGDMTGGVRLLNKYLTPVLTHSDPHTRYYIYRAAAFLCDHLDAQGKPARLRWPADFAGLPADSRTDAATARDWFLCEARPLATAFDARNGNDGYVRGLADLKKWKRLVNAEIFDHETGGDLKQ